MLKMMAVYTENMTRKGRQEGKSQEKKQQEVKGTIGMIILHLS